MCRLASPSPLHLVSLRHRTRLGNPYQTVTDITGTPVLTPTFPQVRRLSPVSSGSVSPTYPLASQRFYPYAFLASPYLTYTASTAPFLDDEGLEFSVSPSVPINGDASGTPILSAVNVYVNSSATGFVLAERGTVALPLLSLQQQYYTL